MEKKTMICTVERQFTKIKFKNYFLELLFYEYTRNTIYYNIQEFNSWSGFHSLSSHGNCSNSCYTIFYNFDNLHLLLNYTRI